MRKLIIGLIAVGFVASLFWGYALIMDAEPIEVRNVTGSDDLEMPESGDAVQRTGDTDVIGLEKARYVVLDPETKEMSRVFGFEKLLNQDMDTTRRQVEKPYMIFYESNFQCRIDADTGMFQTETSGSSSTPKDARLNGNVKIHVMPKPGSKMSEALVEMDDLVFSSERSEFATDRKVHIKSDQVELKGTGLVVIFDSANGRIDYLRIRDLEEIRMQGLTDPTFGAKNAKAETDTVSATPTPAPQTSAPVASSEKAEVDGDKLPGPVRYYQCLLEDNVKIEYGNKIVVSGAEHVNIQNISFDQSVGTDGASEPTKKKSKKVQKTNEPSEKKTETAQDLESSSEVIVTCDGGIILKPMQGEDTERMPVVPSALSVEMGNAPLRIAKMTPASQQTPVIGMANLVGEKDAVAKSDTGDTALKAVSDPNASPPTKFEARKIDYDLLTGSGLAHGPVRFTHHLPPDPNSATPDLWIPVTVTADENARFIADSSQTIKQVIFNGNVMATHQSSQSEFTQLDCLHGNKLTISLDENAEGKPDISHIRMTEGKVFVDSKRTQGDRELSNVKLYCAEISYNRVSDVVLAAGPGKIEFVNNEQLQTAASDPNNPMNRPCVAMVDGFTTIRWDMGKQSIVGDGDQDTMKLAYYPISDGRIQKQVFVYSMRLEMSYLPDTSEVKKVFTDKPIIYEEWNNDMTKRLHYIVGQSLDYDAVDGNGWMKISGTPAVPCNVDGARMPEIFIHPVTGQIKASISTMPGVLKGR
ncbi:MAG: hypothetical protein B6I25_06175 [Planctomycetales bacterium 4572_13]|nr:MAG: hypothetical protein B6I25_06175 [Planctomycetales bacterium 4572_13]